MFKSDFQTMPMHTRGRFRRDHVRNECIVLSFLHVAETGNKKKKSFSFSMEMTQSKGSRRVLQQPIADRGKGSLQVQRQGKSDGLRRAWRIGPTGQLCEEAVEPRKHVPLYGSSSFYTFCCIIVKDNRRTHGVSDYRVSKQQAFHFMTLSSALTRRQISATNFEECAHVLTRY